MQQVKVYNSDTMELIEEDTYTFDTSFDSDGFPTSTTLEDGNVTTFTYETIE